MKLYIGSCWQGNADQIRQTQEAIDEEIGLYDFDEEEEKEEDNRMDEDTIHDIYELPPEEIEDVETLQKLLEYAYDMIGELTQDLEDKSDENQSLFRKFKVLKEQYRELQEKMVEMVATQEERSSVK